MGIRLWLNFYIFISGNPPLVDKICWSLEIRYGAVQLYWFSYSVKIDELIMFNQSEAVLVFKNITPPPPFAPPLAPQTVFFSFLFPGF